MENLAKPIRRVLGDSLSRRIGILLNEIQLVDEKMDLLHHPTHELSPRLRREGARLKAGE